MVRSSCNPLSSCSFGDDHESRGSHTACWRRGTARRRSDGGLRMKVHPLTSLNCVLSVLLALCWRGGYAQQSLSAEESLRYVRLDYTSRRTNDTSRSCGLNASSPCPDIGTALQSGSQGSRSGRSVIVMLQARQPILLADLDLEVAEHVQGVQNVSIEAPAGGGAVSIELQMKPGQTWLLVEGSSHVSITGLSITYLNGHFGTAISLLHSSSVSVSDCLFSGIRKDSHAINVTDSWPVVVQSSRFRGLHTKLAGPDDQTQYRLGALIITYNCTGPCAVSCSAHGGGGTGVTANQSDSDCSRSTTLLVRNCALSQLGFKKQNIDLLRTAGGQGEILHGSGVSLDISSGVTDRVVQFESCSFVNLSSPRDPAIRLVFDLQSAHNRVSFLGCVFSGNYAARGAVFYISLAALANNTILVSGRHTSSRCLFQENFAYTESGVGRVAFYDAPDLWLWPSQVVLEQCDFRGNKAGAFAPLAGGCFTVSYHTVQFSGNWHRHGAKPMELYNLLVNDCNFSQNTAALGAVFYLQKSSVRFSNSSLQFNEGSAVYAETSLVTLAESTQFVGGYSAVQTTTPGTAVALHGGSLLHVDQSSSVLFQDNTAVVSGGSVFVDEFTSSSTLLQVLEFATASNLSSKPCFFEVPGDAWISFGDNASTRDTAAAVNFSHNIAPFGRDVYANSFLPCYASSLYPSLEGQQPASKLPESTRLRPTGPSLSTGPAWILFSSTSCDCLKQLMNGTEMQFWRYERKCNGPAIAADYKQGLGNWSIPYDAAVDKILVDITSWTVDIRLPPRDQFLLPWGTVIWSYYYLSTLNASLAQNIANLTLYPAPGEEFTLTLNTLDARLSDVQASLLLEVVQGDVLLRYGGLQFHKGDMISFPAQHPLVGVALAGKPGAIGSLSVTTDGIVALHPFRLIIPFRLQPCYPGFKPTPLMSQSDTQIRALIDNLTETVSTSSSKSLTGLICACASELTYCSDDGYSVTVPTGYWAGLAGETATNLYTHPERSYIGNLTEYEQRAVALAENFRVLRTDQVGQFFQLDLVSGNWPLRTTDPCQTGDNRTGLLCTECSYGYSLVPLQLFRCENCKNANYSAGIASYVFVTFAFTLLLSALTFLFGVGVGASFDTWSFSFQIAIFISPQLESVVTGQTNIYFGAHQCISENLRPIPQIAATYIIPLELLLSLAIVYILFIKVRWFRLKFASLSFFPTLWSAVLWSYNYVIFTSLPLVTWTVIDGECRVALDPLTKCFDDEHLPYALLATLLLIFTIFILPPMLLIGRHTRWLRPFANVYLAPLREDRYWWIVYALVRRPVLGIVCILSAGTLRSILLIVLLQASLFILYMAMPYRRPIDNYFEVVVHTTLELIAFFLLFEPSTGLYVASYICYWLPSLIAIGIGLYTIRASIVARVNQFVSFLYKHKILKTLQEDSSCDEISKCRTAPLLASSTPRLRTASHYSFRDPLLFDTLQDIRE
ncbi:uncharacterized protein LOC135804799 [Sycon ciliatum]|uniref:uncharacterized protein LOC135804799 n=1 Tax=Sycon ciliatum TaxID=27933 RepID=UPI0031F623C8